MTSKGHNERRVGFDGVVAQQREQGLCDSGPRLTKCVLRRGHVGPHQTVVMWRTHRPAPASVSELRIELQSRGLHVHRFSKSSSPGTWWWKLHFRGRSKLCGTENCLLIPPKRAGAE